MVNYLVTRGSVYTLIVAAICWSFWKRRNKTCFDRKPLRSPIEIIIHAGAFMNYWAGLYKEDLQEKIAEGVRTLVACAHWMIARQGVPQPRMLLPGTSEAQDESQEES
jgi:hypothetical protein